MLAPPHGAPSANAAAEWAATLDLPLVSISAVPQGALLLHVDTDGLELRDSEWPDRGGVRVDLIKRFKRLRSDRTLQRQPLAKAVGHEPATVFDATAGFGEDAALLAMLGHTVIACERHPVLCALLSDGLSRARDDAASSALASRITLVAGDSARTLESSQNAGRRIDVLYLDPMYPAKRKASALPPKRIQLLRRLVGDDMDAPALFEAGRRAGVPRIVVKRPRHAEPIEPGPSFQSEGKLARYDVYLDAASSR
jgi:16S rRNA (guanine1516-N2)-methyltransferase